MTTSVDILDTLPFPVFVADGNGVILHANARAVTKFGALLGHDRPAVTDVLAEHYRDVARRRIAECLATGKPYTLEVEILASSTSSARREFRVAPYLRDGEPPCVTVMLWAPAPDREKELDLLRFSNFAQFTVNPLEITDTSGRIIYANPAYERASGYSHDEIIGQNPNLFSSGKHSRAFWQQMWETISSGHVWTGDVENKRRNGEIFQTRLMISPIMDSGGVIVGYVGMHQDMTERRQLEHQLVQAQKMENFGMLAAGLAHEIGNPLTSISAIVQVVQRSISDPESIARLDLIKGQVSRISGIIRELVDYSRSAPYERIPTQLNAVLRDAVEIVKMGKKTKDIEITMEFAEHLPAAQLMPDRVQQVAINLLMNAVDALRVRRNTARPPKIIVASSSANDTVRFAVSDNADGISADIRERIFEPFFTTKDIGEGTGLGLWVSYTIVKNLGGEISIKSAEGEGTTFIVQFPH